MFLGFVFYVLITLFVPQVAKQHGSQNASKQVAYLWAKSLGKLKVKLSFLILVVIIIVFVKFKDVRAKICLR